MRFLLFDHSSKYSYRESYKVSWKDTSRSCFPLCDEQQRIAMAIVTGRPYRRMGRSQSKQLNCSFLPTIRVLQSYLCCYFDISSLSTIIWDEIATCPTLAGEIFDAFSLGVVDKVTMGRLGKVMLLLKYDIYHRIEQCMKACDN